MEELASHDKMVLKIAFIGAGCINFGGTGRPWDHASRLEAIGGVEVVAIVDPLLDKAEAEFAKRRGGKHADMYAGCDVFGSVEELYDAKTVDAVIIGTPPNTRGCSEKPVELKCLQSGYHVFVEKPLSVAPPEDFIKYSEEINQAVKDRHLIMSVGYMFRYHNAVRMMKQLIIEDGGKVMALNARFYPAYSKQERAFQWNIDLSGGPIVEQATHFLDLMRYLVGEVDLSTIHTMCLREADSGGAGVLHHLKPGMEDGIATEKKVPRATISNWRFKDGGVGSLMHCIALHDYRYDTQLEILMDGLRLTLHEPYHPECKLLVRRSGSDVEEVHEFSDADPYYEELSTFLEAVITRDDSDILSPYCDAVNTYMFSWAIRREGEK